MLNYSFSPSPPPHGTTAIPIGGLSLPAAGGHYYRPFYVIVPRDHQAKRFLGLLSIHSPPPPIPAPPPHPSPLTLPLPPARFSYITALLPPLPINSVSVPLLFPCVYIRCTPPLPFLSPRYIILVHNCPSLSSV